MNSDELITIYMDRFINRTDVWGKQWVSQNGGHGYAYQKADMDTKGGRYRYEPVTPELVARLFLGKVSCAWCAIDQNSCSRWLCFDSDTDNGELEKLDAALRSWGLHIIREGRRPNRAGHLWILLDKPVPVSQLIILSNAMLRIADVNAKTGQSPDGIERYPNSQIGLTQVRGPLGINLKPEAQGVRGWFDGVEHDLREQLEWLAMQPLNRAEDAIREAEKHRPALRVVFKKPHQRRRKLGAKLGRINILEHVQARRVGGELVAQCPLCANEGHDQHRDNLRIKLDGSTFCCAYGGPNQIHKVRYIIAAFLAQRSK